LRLDERFIHCRHYIKEGTQWGRATGDGKVSAALSDLQRQLDTERAERQRAATGRGLHLAQLERILWHRGALTGRLGGV